MNTVEFIATVRRTGQLSPNDPVYTDAEILAEGTQALRDRFAAPLMLCRQGYWLHEVVIVTSSLKDQYKIPANTIVQGLEKLEIADPNSSSYRQLSILTQTQASVYTGVAKGESTYFTLESDQVRLWPAPAGAFNLKFVFYLQPPELVNSAYPVKIVDITETRIAVADDPRTANYPLDVGAKIYIQNHDGSHEIPTFDTTIMNIVSEGLYWWIDFEGPFQGSSLIQVGDYVTPKGKSMFPMLPQELHRPLADYTAAMIWVSKGDKEKAANLSQKAQSGIDRFVDMAVSRVKTRPIRWKRTNSFLRRSL